MNAQAPPSATDDPARDELSAEVRRLRERVRHLESQLSLLLYRPTRQSGLRGECYVMERIDGARPLGWLPYDVCTRAGNGLEVKYSICRGPRVGNSTRRWDWPDVLGRGGSKDYHRLILLGEPDPRHQDHYKDPGAPFVIFDIPFTAVGEFVTARGRNKCRINLNTNPQAAKGRARSLFAEYQLTPQELADKYDGAVPEQAPAADPPPPSAAPPAAGPRQPLLPGLERPHA